MYLERTLSATITRSLRTFPAVLVTGPRQSGKTTLLCTRWQHSHRYASLENPDVRERALSDPVGFLQDHPPPVILDEIQYAPELLSYIKTKIDEEQKPGQWILSGSQVFPLMQGVSESLAGRVAVLNLLPLSQGEARKRPRVRLMDDSIFPRSFAGKSAPAGRRISLARWILTGGYPFLWSRRGVDRRVWMAGYVQTYLERDVRSVLRVGDLATFQIFLRLVASRTGQVLNLSDLARDAGISQPTAKQWLGVLEASHQVFLLRPYFRNFGKRMIKSPKVYFLDTGVATFLMGIHDEETLRGGPTYGALFETVVVVEFVKALLHRGLPASLWYWRSRDGWEVDLLLERGGRLDAIEIKSTSTPRPGHADSIRRWRTVTGDLVRDCYLLAVVARQMSLSPGIRVLPWDLL